MARAKNLLKAKDIDKLTKPGLHKDGDRLYIEVTESGAKRWQFVWMVGKKRNQASLGPYSPQTMSEARRKADEYRALVEKGIDPRAAKKHGDTDDTFLAVAERYIEIKKGSWSDRNTKQSQYAIREHCKPLHKIRMQGLTTEDIGKTLYHLWKDKHPTAVLVRQKIEKVWGYAKSLKLVSGDNPATLKDNLEHHLPSVTHHKVPHKAMPADVAAKAFYVFLEDGTSSNLAAAMILLTGARSGVIRFAKWSEVDFNLKTLNASFERRKNRNSMSQREDFIIPLSDLAMQVLEKAHRWQRPRNPYIFPGQTPGQPIGNSSIQYVFDGHGYKNYDPHGLRSTLSTWANETEAASYSVIERTLDHKVGSGISQVYDKSKQLEQRRKLQQAWADFIRGFKENISVAA